MEKSKFRPPPLRGSKTPERISMKAEIYNYVACITTHANPCGAVTT